MNNIDALTRALEAGYAAPSLADGMELKIESLEATMMVVTYSIDNVGYKVGDELRPILFFGDKFYQFKWNKKLKVWEQVRSYERSLWSYFIAVGRPLTRTVITAKRLSPYKLRQARRVLARRMAKELGR